VRNGIELDGIRADDVVERHALSPESEMSIAHGDAASVDRDANPREEL
jgi:hypothetical protein